MLFTNNRQVVLLSPPACIAALLNSPLLLVLPNISGLGLSSPVLNSFQPASLLTLLFTNIYPVVLLLPPVVFYQLVSSLLVLPNVTGVGLPPQTYTHRRLLLAYRSLTIQISPLLRLLLSTHHSC